MNLKIANMAVAAAMALALPATASAAGAGGIMVRPEQRSGNAFSAVAFLDLATKPGRSTAAGRLLIHSLERRPLIVELDAVDALTASNLGYAYTVSGVPARGQSRWIRLSERRLVLAPGQTAVVSVAARPATNAKPGDYLSGISVEAVGQRKRSDGKTRMAISSSRRYVVGFQMRIPGPRRARVDLKGAAVKALPAGVTFLLTARNSGNVMLANVRGRISVYRAKRRVATTPVGPGTFVTGTSARLQLLAAAERPDHGTKYRLRARLHYRGRTVRLNEDVVFGEREQRRQETYGRRPDGGSEKGGGLPLLLLLALGIPGVAAIALAHRRHRRTRARLARLDALEQQIAPGSAGL